MARIGGYGYQQPQRVKMDTGGKNFLDAYQQGLAGFQALRQSEEKHAQDMQNAEMDRIHAANENERRNRELALKEREDKRNATIFQASVAGAGAASEAWDGSAEMPAYLSAMNQSRWNHLNELHRTIADKVARGENADAEMLAFKQLEGEYNMSSPNDRRRFGFAAKTRTLADLYNAVGMEPDAKVLELIGAGASTGGNPVDFDPSNEDLALLNSDLLRLQKYQRNLVERQKLQIAIQSAEEFWQAALSGTLTGADGETVEAIDMSNFTEDSLFAELQELFAMPYDGLDIDNELQDVRLHLQSIQRKMAIWNAGPGAREEYDYKAGLTARYEAEMASFNSRQAAAQEFLPGALKALEAGTPLSPEQQFALAHMDASRGDKGTMFDLTYDDDDSYREMWDLVKERRMANGGGSVAAHQEWQEGAALRQGIKGWGDTWKSRRSTAQSKDATFWGALADDINGWGMQGTEGRYYSGVADVDEIVNEFGMVPISVHEPTIDNPEGWSFDIGAFDNKGVAHRQKLLEAIKSSGVSVKEFFGIGRRLKGAGEQGLTDAVQGVIAGDDYEGAMTVDVTHKSLLEAARAHPEMWAVIMQQLVYPEDAPVSKPETARTRAQKAQTEQDRQPVNERRSYRPQDLAEEAVGPEGVVDSEPTFHMGTEEGLRADPRNTGLGMPPGFGPQGGPPMDTPFNPDQVAGPGSPPFMGRMVQDGQPMTNSERYALYGDDARRQQQLTDQGVEQPDLGLGEEPRGYHGGGAGYPGAEPVPMMDDPGAPYGAGSVLNPGVPLSDEEIMANEQAPASQFDIARDELSWARKQPSYAKFARKYMSYRRNDIVRLLMELDAKRPEGLTDDMRIAYAVLTERLKRLDGRTAQRNRASRARRSADIR